MKTKTYAISTLIITLLLILAIGCKKDKEEPEDPTPPTYTNGEGEIGSIGGTIMIDDESSPLNGVVINIPEGALTSDEYITISLAPDNIILSEDSTAQIISFQPSGLKFNKPIEIGLPTNSGLGFNELELVNYDPDSAILTELPKTKLVNNILYGETDNFSYYLVFKKTVYTAIEMLNIDGSLGVNVRIGSVLNQQQAGLRGVPNLHPFIIASLHPNPWSVILDKKEIYVKLKLRVTLYEDGFWLKKRVVSYSIVVSRFTDNYDYGVRVYVPWDSEPIFSSGILSQDPFEALELFYSAYPLIFYFDEEFIPNDDIDIQIDPSKRYFVKTEWEYNNNEAGDWMGRFTKIYRANNSDEAMKLSEMEAWDNDRNDNFIDDDFEENKPPNAIFEVTPEQGEINTNFKFDASKSSDLEDPVEDLECLWDFEGDGVWDTDWSNSKVIYHQFNEAGNYTAKLIVKDTEGATNYTTKTIAVNDSGGNDPPEIPSLIYPPEEEIDATSVILKWECNDPENDPLKYEIYFGNNNPPLMIEPEWEEKSKIVTDLLPGETYFWKIVAKDDHGNSTSGPTWIFSISGGSGIPVTPNNVYAGYWPEENGTGVYWKDNSSNEDGFKVYRAVNTFDDDYYVIEQTISGIEIYLDENIQSYNYYCYKITAFNNSGESEHFEFAIIPKTPVNLEGTANDNDITLTWDDPDDSQAQHFYIYRSDNSTNDFNKIGEVTASTTTYSDNAVSSGNDYHYRIEAVWENSSDHACRSLPTDYIGPFTVSGGSGDTFTDPRDGQTYSIITIGTQTWFAENLNYETETSYCYDNDQSNCDIYGRLYYYSTAVNACPNGWHLPTDSEWDILVNFLGGDNVAGGKMKETGLSHWDPPNTGATNESGFTALPGGRYSESNSFYYLGTHADFWSLIQDGIIWARSAYHNSTNVGRNNAYTTFAHSVRCIKD